ncbi:MAG: formate dehydrogenase [Rubrivivax sp.]
MDIRPPQPETTLLSRRRVFAGAGTAGALAAAAVVLPSARQAAETVEPVAALPTDDAHGRYQLTQHVQRYYQTAKV